MTHLQHLRRQLDSHGLHSEAFADALRECGRSVDVRTAVEKVKSPAQSSGTVSSLYVGYRMHLLEHVDGYQLSVCRLSEEAGTVSTSPCRSAALCLSADEPIRFERYRDPGNHDLYDLPRPEPAIRDGEYLVAEGDIVVTEPGAEWGVPAGRFDGVFLKIDGPTVAPITVAFDRSTLAPVSIGFSDQNHTARDFFGSLVFDLLEADNSLLAAMSAEETEALSCYVAYQAEREDVHLITRWKFLQSLGRLQPTRARSILSLIAERSQSQIGARARALVSLPAGTA